jgi:DNA repair protein REV1
LREEGPIEGDVGALERYLVRVVSDERDLEKVVGVVRWLRWLVDDDAQPHGAGNRAWRRAIEGIEHKIQEAVRERGMGALVL